MGVGCLLGRGKRINCMSGLKTGRDKMGRIRWEGGEEMGLREVMIGEKARIEWHWRGNLVLRNIPII